MKKDKEKPEDDEEVDSEESDLEKEIENDSPIDSNQLREFISRESRAPVLDTVESERAPVRLVQGVQEERFHQPLNNEFKDPFKYNMGNSDDEDQTKYVSSSQINVTPQHINIMNVGRENPFERMQKFEQGAFFTSTHQKNNGGDGIEKYTMPENIDSTNVGRKDPFKQEVKKYDPKLPKH